MSANVVALSLSENATPSASTPVFDVQAALQALLNGEGDDDAAVRTCLDELRRQVTADLVCLVKASAAGDLFSVHAAGGANLRDDRLAAILQDAERLAVAGCNQPLVIAETGLGNNDDDAAMVVQPVSWREERIGDALVVRVIGRCEPGVSDLLALSSAATLLACIDAMLENQEELARQSERFAQLTRSIPGVVYQRIVRPDGDIRYTYISESAQELFGIPAKRIIEDPSALFASYSQNYREKFRQKLIEASKKLSIWDVEASITKPDGSTRYTHAIARPQRLGDGSVLWTGVILDATRIKEAERQAAQAEARTRKTIVESLDNGFLMFNANDKLVLSNSAFHRLYPQQRAVIRSGASYRDVIAAELELEHHDTRSASGLKARLLERVDLHVSRKSFVLERRISLDTWVQINEHRTRDGSTVVLYTDVSEMRRREERMHHMALHDALTGLPNRVLYRSRLEEALDNTRRYGGQTGVIAIDLDNFKHVNDTLGHPAGDTLLKAAGERIRECLRETDTLARLGGDEFAVIVPEIVSLKSIASLAQRIIEVAGTPFEVDGQMAAVGASIGIAVSSGKANDADTLIKQADLALYRAKADNKNCYRFFARSMDERAQARRMLELDLRDALKNEELELHFQPQIDTADGHVKGFEALVRWRHRDRGLLAPAEFIELAEETGLIVPLGKWVLERACKIAAEWSVPVVVAVNVSPVQLKRQEFVDLVASALQESGLDPTRLELEITETVFLRDTKKSLAILRDLKALGVRIAMDDFGTGYSSLGNLRRFPFDKIKIDKSFIMDLDAGSESAAIIKAVVGMGKTLSVDTTAEGVETLNQVEHLALEGCTQLQGYYYSQPRPAADVADMLKVRSAKRNKD